MKIIYAKKTSGIDEQGSFQNPEYYDKPDKTVKEVVIYGYYPKIEADYRQLNIPINVRDVQEDKALLSFEELKEKYEQAVAENTQLKAKVAELETLEMKLKKPTAAELKAAKALEDAAKVEQAKE